MPRVIFALFVCSAFVAGQVPKPVTGPTPGDRIKVKDGFRVELIYPVPRETQGSWISLAVDPKGRLYTSDQYGSLYRITPPPIGQLEPSSVERIPVELGEAHGLLWAFDSLYVVVNRGDKYASGLYRLRDTDGDDQLDSVEKLRDIDGDGEHGPHAVLLGPDGKSLYLVIGNHTKLMPVDTSRVPRCWAEDMIVPRMWDAKGHARGIYAPGGHIVKTDPDGKAWELVSMGYRNSYDAAFNRDGELFTFDSDMEWDMNTPWYRPTRVCHVTSGSEFGWRSGSGNWPDYYADSLPPVIDVGPGSPTGMVFGYGAKFPAKYQNALFMCDWSYGKLYACHLTPKGSSYAAELEEFLNGLPLPLTDIVVNPLDGAMYFTTGGRRTASGLYRITYVGGESTKPAKLDHAGADDRAVRHSLEAWHGKSDPAAAEAAWPLLGHSDRFIRFAARTVLEHQDPIAWQDKAFAERDVQAAMTAFLALARVGEKSLQSKLIEALDAIAWTGLTESQQLELIRIYELALLRMGPADAATVTRVTRRFDPMIPTWSPKIDSELCKLLSFVQAPSVAAKALTLLERAGTQEAEMDYATTLRAVTAGWTPGLRREYFEWFHRAAGYRGGASFEGFVKYIKDDAMATLSEEDKTALADVLKPRESQTAPIAKPRPFVRRWTMAELLPGIQSGLSNRDFDRGKELFTSTRCVACHRYNNEGGANGPDLTMASGRFTVGDLLESIVDPSKVISDQYAATVVTTATGQVVIGRVVNLNNDSIYINTNMLEPNSITIVNRNNIESMSPSKVSMMPDGLIDTCTVDEIRDLVAYLLSRGNRNNPMFSEASRKRR